MRLLVTGASGLLGLHLAWLAAKRGYEVTGAIHAHSLREAPFATWQGDLTQPGELERMLDETRPEAIVHTAALAYPERCEQYPTLAEQLNACLPGELAQAAVAKNIRLVHISTDAVFDGYRGGYCEEHPTNPRNLYARAKLEGERRVAVADPRALIIRGVFYGWSLSGRRSLAEWFYTNLAAGNPIRGFTDAIFCPLEAGDMAGLVLALLEKGLGGVYHMGTRDAISKYDFGVTIARLFGFDPALISPASVYDAGLPATRAANLWLRCDKLVRNLGQQPPTVLEGLQKFYRQHQEGLPQRIAGLRG